MRLIVRTLACVLSATLLMAATPARADGVNNFLAGITGLLQFPADPVMHVYQPPEDFEELPAAPVTSRVVGLVSGTLLGVYRAGMGVFDVVLSPLWILPTMSPEARWPIFDSVEYE